MSTTTTTSKPIIEDPKTKVNTTLLGSIFQNKSGVFKLLLLITYVIIVCYFLVNNPNKMITNYSSIFISIILLSSFFIFYINLKINKYYINFKFDIFKSVLVLICFIILSLFFYYYNPGGYVMNKLSTLIYILIFISGLFCIFQVMLYSYSANNTNSSLIDASSSDYKTFSENNNTITNIMKYFLLLSFIISFITIIVIYGFQIMATSLDYSMTNNSKIIVNIITIIIIAAILYKLFTYSNFYQENPLAQLIINSIFYIPCLLVSLIDNFVKLTGLDIKKSKDNGLFKPTTTDYILLIIAILINVIYFSYHNINDKLYNREGILLINNPIYTNKENTLASYEELNNSDNFLNNNTEFNYNYAISSWIYIDAASSSMSNAYTKYTSLLSYSGKPNILYKGTNNTLIITMDNLKANSFELDQSGNKILYDLDESGNRIIYVKKDVLLQKWNNIIINYNGGTLDIFYNGELVKSAIEVVPYMTYDTLTVGSESGIHCGICNVKYFNKSLNVQEIYYLYNSVKDNTPPTYKNTDETIINISK